MRAWNFVSAFSFFTHLLIASVILVGTDPTERHSNFFGTVTHPWIEKRSSMDHIKSNAMQIFGTLGENHWINAVAWDVLFAAVGMACWSAAGNLDARSMVKCALFPWLDELHGNLKLWKYNVPDVVGRGGLRGGATRSGGEYLKNFDLHEDHQSKRSSSRSSARAQSVDPEPALGTKRKPGRPPKRPSSRAASQQPEEPPQRRSSSRSTRVSTRSPSVGRRSSSRGGRTVSSSIQLDPTDMRRRASSKKSQDRETRRLPDSEKDEQTRLAEAFHCGAGMAEQAGLTLTLFIVGGLGMASAGVFGVDEL